MKKVFSNANECVHVWASQTQSEGRSSNVFFEGKTIYSYGYHFPAARFIDDKTVLITNQQYSRTTSKHMRMIIYAVKHLDRIYCNYIPQYSGGLYKHHHEENLKCMVDNIVILMQKNKRARVYSYDSEILSEVKNYNRYSKFFKFRKLLPEDIASLSKRLQVALVQKEKQARRERDEDKARKLERERLGKIAEVKRVEALGEWVNGDNSKPWYNFHNLPCRLRISGDAIQTSWGASVPIADYRLSYAVLKSNPQRLLNCKCGYYTVNAVNDDSITIGCHNISMMEIDRIGQLLQ